MTTCKINDSTNKSQHGRISVGTSSDGRGGEHSRKGPIRVDDSADGAITRMLIVHRPAIGYSEVLPGSGQVGFTAARSTTTRTFIWQVCSCPMACCESTNASRHPTKNSRFRIRSCITTSDKRFKFPHLVVPHDIRQTIHISASGRTLRHPIERFLTLIWPSLQNHKINDIRPKIYSSIEHQQHT
jgi:hypothetical protein